MIKKLLTIMLIAVSGYCADLQYQPLLFNGFQDYDANYVGGLSSTTIISISTSTVTNLLSSTNTWTGGNWLMGNVGIGTIAPTSTLDVRGSLGTNTKITNTSYVVTSTDTVIVGSCTASNITITLPVSSTCIGRNYSIWNVSNNTYTVTVTPSGTEKIRGTNSKTLSTGSRIDIQSIGISGREWW